MRKFNVNHMQMLFNQDFTNLCLSVTFEMYADIIYFTFRSVIYSKFLKAKNRMIYNV